MMSLQTLRFSVSVKANCPSLFAFHSDPANLVRVSPPWIRLGRVQASLPPREGDIFEVVVSQAGVPLRWVGQWISVEEPFRLVDAGIETPFASWRHEHRFEDRGKFSMIIDEVHFELRRPWSKFPPARWVAALLLGSMFFWRHYRSRCLFGTPDSIA